MIMIKCAELGLEIDPKPDYPLQLVYMDGEFEASYEPNFKSIICETANTPEEALEKLLDKLKNATK